jgi:DNA-binding transcriptional regulator YhcF (GntR family)
MAKQNGYILLDREIEDWRHSDSLAMIGFWVRLLILANWKSTDKVKRGEILISVPNLAHMFNISEKTASRYLKRLAESGEIEMSTNHKRTRIVIPNYDLYQSGKIYRTADRTAVQSDVQTPVHTADRTAVQSPIGKNTGNHEIMKSSNTGSGNNTPRTTPPTADEVLDFVKAEGLSLDVEAFLNYNNDREWTKSGKSVVSEWKDLVRAWCKKDEQFSKERQTKGTGRGKKQDKLPEWYDADPNRKGSDEQMSDEEMAHLKEMLASFRKEK